MTRFPIVVKKEGCAVSDLSWCELIGKMSLSFLFLLGLEFLEPQRFIINSVRVLLWWGVHILLWRIQCWHSLRKQFGIRDSGHRKNARVRLHQLARPIEVVSS